MSPLVLLRIGLFVLGFFRIATAASPDEPPPSTDDDDFTPAIFFIMIVFLILFLILLGVGVGIAMVLVVLCAALAGLGILSSSALIGLANRKFSSGLRAFHYQALAAAGLPAGVCGLWLGVRLCDLTMSHREIFGLGATAGVCAGLLLAYVLDKVTLILLRKITAPAQ